MSSSTNALGGQASHNGLDVFTWFPLRGSDCTSAEDRVPSLRVLNEFACARAENLETRCTRPCGVVHELFFRESGLVALPPVQHNIQKELTQGDSDEIWTVPIKSIST